MVTILLEVRTDVTESGENPYETFGLPRSYAKAFGEGSRRRWIWVASLVCAMAASIAVSISSRARWPFTPITVRFLSAAIHGS